MDLNPFVNANKEWFTRASGRWAAAATAINNETYEVKRLFHDLLDSWIGDPLEWWGDIQRESDSTRILIPLGGQNQGKSAEIPVPHPAQTKITSLVRLGGNEAMQSGTHVLLDKPPQTAAGTVQVVIQNLGSGHPAGPYLGFIYEDQRLISTVVALR